MRSLYDITQDLVALADSGDIEAAHGRADDLLVEAIRAKAVATDYKRVEELIDAYENVPKWYA
jgi:hypothetical protein